MRAPWALRPREGGAHIEGASAVSGLSDNTSLMCGPHFQSRKLRLREGSGLTKVNNLVYHITACLVLESKSYSGYLPKRKLSTFCGALTVCQVLE